MRSLNIEGFLDFSVGCKEQIEQDMEGNEQFQQKVYIERENGL